MFLNRLSDSQKALLVWLLLLPYQYFFIRFQGPFSFDEGVYLATVKAISSGGRLYYDVDYTQWPLFAYVLKWAAHFGEIIVGRALTFNEMVISCRTVIVAHGAVLAVGYSRLLQNFEIRGRLNTAAVFVLLTSTSIFFLSHTILGNLPAVAWAIYALSSERIAWMAIAMNMKLVILPFAVLFKKRMNIVWALFLSLGLAILTGFPIGGVSSLQGGALTNPIERTKLLDKISWMIEGHGIRTWGESGVLKQPWVSPLFILGLISVLVLIYAWFKKLSRKSLNLKDELQWPSTELRAIALFLVPLAVLLIHSTVWRHHVVILVPGSVLALVFVLKNTKFRAVLNLLAIYQLVFVIYTSTNLTKANAAWDEKSSKLVAAMSGSSVLENGLVADHPWLALQSGNKILGHFVDPSKVRIRTGQIQCDDLFMTKNKAYILSSDRFTELKCPTEFASYMRSRGYHEQITVGDFTLWSPGHP